MLISEEIIKYFTGSVHTSEDLNTSELMVVPSKHQVADLGKRSTNSTDLAKPIGGLVDEKSGSLKLLKTDSVLGTTSTKLLEGIEPADKTKADAFFEECKKNLHLVRSKERALESKNTRMRTHKVL
jgi:hypothetical protein